MDKSEDHNQDIGSQRIKQVKNKRTLDTVFPSTWLVVFMVAMFLFFNILVGMKVFSLQKEKAVIEILKARYESYTQIIRDVEDKEEMLKILTQKIVPLEKRAENAQKEVEVSNERVKKNRNELNKIKASKAELLEELSAAHTTIAELSNEKQTLREEKTKLEKLVVELNIDEKRTDQRTIEKRQKLTITEENIRAAETRLKNQQAYIKNVIAANSDFDDMRKQLSEFTKKMEETQLSAGESINDLKKVVAGVADEKNQLSIQTESLTSETKNVAQFNASIEKELSGFKEQNKAFKSEIENVTSTSGQMKNIAEAIKKAETNMAMDEAIISENLKSAREELKQVATANQELVRTSNQFTAAITGVASQGEKLDIYMQKIAEVKGQLSIQIENLTSETKNVAQFNASIEKELSGFKEQNKAFKSEIENVTSTSGQMKNIAEAIKKIETNVAMDEAIISDNLNAAKEELKEVATANQALVQTSNQFTTAVTGVASQGEKLDTYIQKIANFPDMKVQVIAFKKILNEIEEVRITLSERVSAIQSSFDGKLEGMNLSFGGLEKDFTNLLLKIDGVEQALIKIAVRTQEMNKKSFAN